MPQIPDPPNPSNLSQPAPAQPSTGEGAGPARPAPGSRMSWLRLFFATLLAVDGYLLLEWLFFITKPSFMSTMNLGGQVLILLNSTLLAMAPALILLCLAALIALVVRPGRRWLLRLAAFVPAFILSALILVWIDNFTYTIFHFGVVKLAGALRVLYAVAFMLAVACCLRKVLRFCNRAVALHPRAEALALGIGTAVLLLLAIIPAALTGDRLAGKDLLNVQPEEGAPQKRPNIIIFVSDGLNATNLSLYGYERKTTPFLDKIGNQCLIAENAFNNCGSSGGSIASMFSARLPTETHMVYPPDILHGVDAFRNFPAMLKRLGYLCVDISTRYYADAPDLNILNGFDEANFRSLRKPVYRKWLEQAIGSDASYFASCVEERIEQRLKHIFFLRSMEGDPANEVQADNAKTLQNDPRRVQGALDAIRTAKAPIFLHLHLNTTHGGKFFPREQHFSKGMEQFREWMTDFYDDGIRSADQYFKQVYDLLQQTGKLENTILIFTTDHSQRYFTTRRIPLVFHFPRGEHAGRLAGNAQLMDIAPTVLDYLNVRKPAWMSGVSLFDAPQDPQRPIFSASWNQDLMVQSNAVWTYKPGAIKPPFYNFGAAYVILGHMWYGLDMVNLAFDYGDVPKHTAPCKLEELPKSEAAFDLLLAHLEQNGFDLAGVKEKIKRPEIKKAVVADNVADLMKRTTNIPEHRHKYSLLQLYTRDTVQIRFPVDDPEQGDFIAIESEHKLIPGQDYIISFEILDPYGPSNQGGLFEQQVFFNGKPMWTHDLSGNKESGWKPLHFKYKASGEQLKLLFKAAASGQPQPGWKWGGAASLAVRKVEVVLAGENPRLPR